MTQSAKTSEGGVFWTKFELSLSKTPNKEASPATARQARHTTEKYSLLFSFCALPILSSFNEKSIFLRCSALQVFGQVAGVPARQSFSVGGTSLVWFRSAVFGKISSSQ